MKPWLILPSKWAHDLVPSLLPLVASVRGAPTPLFRPLQWQGLQFDNPIGIAGGVDKSGACLLPWQKLGAGFLEVGTITPHPQGPNPGEILKRHTPSLSVWNKMGFPNAGVESLENRLKKIRTELRVPLFINLGKNRHTPNEKAHEDYLYGMYRLFPYADVFTINISSPNTKDLRQLQTRENLQDFLQPLIDYKTKNQLRQPLLLKLSPDMDESDLQQVLDTTAEMGVDGWILTNTTLQRPDPNPFPTEGGVSGAFLRDRSRTVLREALQHLRTHQEKKLVISVGGISTPEDILERLDLGAHLVQVYSALIFEGPLFFQKTLQRLQREEQTLII